MRAGVFAWVPGGLVIAVLASLAWRPVAAQELKTRFSSYESTVAYDSMFPAERDILEAAVSGSAGSHLAVRCPALDRQASSTLRLLGFCVTPEYVPQDLSQGSPGLFSAARGAITVDCGVCPLQDAFGNFLCKSYERACATEADVRERIAHYYESGPFCHHGLSAETGWSYFPSEPGWWTGSYPGDTAAYRVLYTKSLAYDVWVPAEATGCNDPVKVQHDWGLTSRTFKSCPLGYYRTSFRLDEPVEEPSCGNSYASRLQVLGNKEKSAGACGTAHPCYPTTGVKTLTEPDYVSPGLTLTRYFHSEMWERDYAALGRGWSHNYSERLLPGDGGVVRHLDGAGNIERFACVDAPACSRYRSVNVDGHLLRSAGAGWVVLSPDGPKKTFDQAGRLILIEDRAGAYARHSISYTPDDKVDSVMDQQGRSLRFSYNADGLVDAVTLPSGEIIQYRYRQPADQPAFVARNQQLVQVIRQDRSQRVYHYEDSGGDGAPRHVFLVTGITDERGIRLATFTYDESARVTGSQLADGADRVRLHYVSRPGEDENWTVTQLTRPLGAVETYGIKADPFRKPAAIGDDRGDVVLAYDYGNRVVGRLDREGNRTAWEYADGMHRTRQIEAVGTPVERSVDRLWNNEINRIVEQRAPGQVTRYTYNERGQVLGRTEVDTESLAERRWSYTYVEAPAASELIGRLAAVDGPRTDVADVTRYDYYRADDPGGAYLRGDLHTITNALGHITEFLAYDADGRPLRVRDATGVVKTLTYHSRGWLASYSAAGRTTRFSHDGAGNLTRVTQADGSFIDYRYDHAGRLIGMADNEGNLIEFTLDAAGNRIEERTVDAAGQVRRQMSRVFDQFGKLTALVDGNGHETLYSYDRNGNPVSRRDPDHGATHFEYDPLDRLIRTIDAALGETSLAYDDRDNLLTVTDPLGNLTVYGYDGLDNLTQVDSPDSGITAHAYDSAGNRVSSTDARGVRTQYRYDALGRLISIAYPADELDVLFGYDTGTFGAGRLTEMDDALGTESYGYDEHGNLISVVRDINGESYTVAYGYNATGRLSRITYPSGMVVEFHLDSSGRVAAVSQTVGAETRDLVTDVRHAPFGPISGFTFGNGLMMDARLDLDYRLDELHSGALDWRFQYDEAGNVLAIIDRIEPENDQVFGYDRLHRLTYAEGAHGAEAFAYDANGNRLTHLDGSIETGYGYAPRSNRLVRLGDRTLERDAAGNRVAMTDETGFGVVYEYGAHNRLARVAAGDGEAPSLQGEYGYDGRGQRVSKSTAAGTVHFIYGPGGQLLGEYGRDGHGPIIKEYVYLDGRPVAVHVGRTDVQLPPPVYLVVDNDEPRTGGSGIWTLRTDEQQYGAGFRLGGARPGSTYRWFFTTPVVGKADVYAWWVGGRGHSDLAQYVISSHGGDRADTVVMSQKSGGGRWNHLGSYDFIGDPGEYIQLSSANGPVAADAVRLAVPQPPVVRQIRATHFVHTDHLGAPRLVSDDTQTVLWRWGGKPFGGLAPDEDPDGDGERLELNLRFPGQYFDPETGLHYNYFRDYDPGTGRYLASDPIGQAAGTDVFGYAAANPLAFIDPSGLEIVGTWAAAPRAHDIKAGFPRWKGYAFGDPRLLPPGIRVGWFEVDVSARVSYQVRCEEFAESELACLGERPRVWYLSSAGAGPISHTVEIPYRFSIGPAWFKWSAFAARIAKQAEEQARSALVRLARELYQDPTLMCVLSQ
jgi:RHS repeat-associated protein